MASYTYVWVIEWLYFEVWVPTIGFQRFPNIGKFGLFCFWPFFDLAKNRLNPGFIGLKLGGKLVLCMYCDLHYLIFPEKPGFQQNPKIGKFGLF